VPSVLPGLVRYCESTSWVASVPLLPLGGVAFYFGQAEIENLGVAALRDEEVRRLNITMDDSLRMRRVPTIGNFDGDSQQRI